MNFSLPKSLILKKNTDFHLVFNHGQKISSEYFMATVYKQDELKIGFTTKKNYKNKPERNKLERLTRELWRINFRDYSINNWIVIIPKAIILNTDFETLEKDFRNLLSKLEKI